MKTETVIITSRGSGMAEALLATEKLGADNGLAKKEKLRLRLLSEELIGLMRGIAGDVEALYWVEQAEKKYELHLKANVPMAPEIRRQLLAASSSGKNAAARGFMGKLREMVAVALLPQDQETAVQGDMAMGVLREENGSGRSTIRNPRAQAYAWSMKQYKSELKQNSKKDEKAAEAWDELEKSIVANLADEVSVSIVGSSVEITIFKTF